VKIETKDLAEACTITRLTSKMSFKTLVQPLGCCTLLKNGLEFRAQKIIFKKFHQCHFEEKRNGMNAN
jgi:hypothetical protein